jgi:hypothetical protein
MATSELRGPLERDTLPERLREFIPGRVSPEIAIRAIETRIASDPHGALRDAQKLAQDAREHKRLANLHRRRAAVAWASFQEFKCKLESLGIQVVIESANPIANATQGGTSDRSDQRDAG